MVIRSGSWGWLLEMVLEDGCWWLFLMSAGGHCCGWAIWVVGRRVSSCIFLGISYYLGAAAFEGIFSGYFWLFIWLYIYNIIHFCLVFLYIFVTITTYGPYYQCRPGLLFYCFAIVYFYLVAMLLLINLPLYYFIISHTKYFFSQDFLFSLFFQTNCKNCKKYITAWREWIDQGISQKHFFCDYSI